MFDTAEALTRDLLRRPLEKPGADGRAAARQKKGRGRSSERPSGNTHRAVADSSTPRDDAFLAALGTQVEVLLPWWSRATGKPVAMWVDEVGLVSSMHEPFPPGTPYVNVCAASWEAAEAIWESLREIARIDEVHWMAGWRCKGAEAKVIRIYPAFDGLEFA